MFSLIKSYLINFQEDLVPEVVQGPAAVDPAVVDLAVADLVVAEITDVIVQMKF